MSETLDTASFIERSRRAPVLDVRTPAEYAKGHLPGAYNLPLFSNEERAEIGTLYKQAGREAAMLRGLSGSKMRAAALAASWRRAGSGRRCSRPRSSCSTSRLRSAWTAWWPSMAGTTPPGWSRLSAAIGKRLGSLRAKQARQAVCDGAFDDACRHLLAYYDTAYRHSLNKRNAAKQHHIDLPTPPTPDAFADQLLETTLV